VQPIPTEAYEFYEFATSNRALFTSVRVAGRSVRKCPLTARWLITSDERKWFLRRAVRGYLLEKKGLRRLIWFQRCRRASINTA
jgi:hypothetical protein